LIQKAKRTPEDVEIIANVFKRWDFFKNMPPFVLEQVANCVSYKHVAADEIVFEYGELGD